MENSKKRCIFLGKALALFGKSAALFAACAASFLAVSCNDSQKQEERAREIYAQAEEAYRNGDDSLAYRLIDSIKASCPKAFETRQKGLDLKNRIVITSAQEQIALADSMRLALEREGEQLRRGLRLVKDAQYEDEGNYLAPSQLDEANASRSYLRAQVSESGNLVLTSVARSGRTVKHRGVLLRLGDREVRTTGGEAFTQGTGRKVDYTEAQGAVEVAAFVAGNEGAGLKLFFLTDGGPVAVPLTAADRKAISAVYRCYENLAKIEKLKKETEEAYVKIRFYEQKSRERRPPHS